MVMVTNQRKAALREKQDSKQHKIISIKFSIIVWSTTGKYGKLIHVITLSGGFYPFGVMTIRISQNHAEGLFFIENFQLSRMHI